MTKRTAHKNYFHLAAFSLLTAMVVLFYGCKQLSHTEKDKYTIKPPTVDSTVVVQERITDTIMITLDSIAALDTIPVLDTVHSLDSIAVSESDSINVETQNFASLQDSINTDSLKKVKPQRIEPRRSESAIETKVICSAVDSSYRDMNKKKIYYFGQAEAKYDDITLTAACLEFDLETSTCRAYGVADSLGKLQGRPVFTQGESTFEAVEMLYNFKTKKGIITKVWTEENDGYLHGERIKRMDDNTINIRSGG